MAAHQRTPLESTKELVALNQRRRESVADDATCNEMIDRPVVVLLLLLLQIISDPLLYHNNY